MKINILPYLKNILVFTFFVFIAFATEDKPDTTKTEKATKITTAYSILAGVYDLVENAKTDDSAYPQFSSLSFDASQHEIGKAFHPQLKRFSTNSDEDWETEYKEWYWINGLYVSDMEKVDTNDMSSSTLNDIQWKTSGWKDLTHMVVIRELPGSQMPKDSSGESFESGIFNGWVYLVDVKANTILSADKLLVFNSDEISYNTRGAFSEDSDSALMDDFMDNMKTALNDATQSEFNF